MQSILLSREEVGRRAKELYENSIRQQVEREENFYPSSNSCVILSSRC
ncbi:hypothetical protein COO91_02922 [Nostoc flagelliforme CCNUN1]|uniref:Uncharacterized protein n=1 Tax=Nostoc flagelliforme CCNUN1 TaxID=2038116 RepID=A0A2K8SNQ9_9NOSO|nr:hypothetical protein COO91_02922 [Nostoc flagelliforme CCNUN1]